MNATNATSATNAAKATNATRALGRYGEELAARRLAEAGMTVLARNWRCGRTGEIDIVARDSDARGGAVLVVCEVKTRRSGSFEHPMAAVTEEKADRLRRLAACWLERCGGPPPGGVRIDLIGVVLPRRGPAEIEHARGVA
ncbi:YraN family protein [Streptomyces sp. NPDC056244]|uniref:YraN family protein n=1 Tax=unclassified Streptomyces TaxID=2593676 RepID=UPI0035D5FF80